MPKVGDHDVSPYLTQRLRSIEEVQAERERRRRELSGAPQAPAQNPAPPLKPAAESPPANDPSAKRPGQILDEKA